MKAQMGHRTWNSKQRETLIFSRNNNQIDAHSFTVKIGYIDIGYNDISDITTSYSMGTVSEL